MDSKESSASFNSAAKHLFRHLHDPHALRQNPLVSHLFRPCAKAGLERVRGERAVVYRIRELVRRGAEHCRDIDLERGKSERALRQHAIITLQCLEQRPIREVAAAVGISYYHCYRERASICRHVARYVSEHCRAQSLEYLPALDEFGLLLNHARYRAAFLNPEAALQAFDDLARLAPSPDREIEALRVGALLSMDFGDLSPAENAYAAARALSTEHSAAAPPLSRELAQASIDLLGSELAYRRGENSQALLMSERANARLEASQAGAAPHVRELYTESLFALGVTSFSLGNTAMGYKCVLRAEASLRHIPVTSLPLRARIMASLWKLRNYLLLDGEHWYPSWLRLECLLTAFEQAYTSGSLGCAIDALVVLTEHHAFTGNDDEALRAGRFAVLLAKQHRTGLIHPQTLIEVGTRLLTTRHWEFASSLLTGVQYEGLDSYHRELLSYFEVERLLRLRRFQDALTLATGGGDHWRWATLTVRRQLVAAAAAHAVKQVREARTLIESAIPAAEGLCSAPILRDAYRVAGMVTGESRFKRQASEIARLLIA
jgi:hypothetical protein